MRGYALLGAILFLTAPVMAGASVLAGQTAPTTTGQTASQDQGADSITVTGDKNRKKRVVCRTAVSTGSLFAKRTCMTAAEWEERAERDRDNAARLQQEQRRRDATQAAICAERGGC